MTASISIPQIKYLLALEQTGSFSLAAEACFVTQSTLSTMIKKLETQIGLSLFDRSSKPIQMTEEGSALLSQFRQVQREMENLEELIQLTKNEFYGSMRIGIIPTIAPFLLPLFLDKLVGKYPHVIFSIDEITTNDITNRVKQRELDVGILSLPVNEKDLLQQTLFLEDFLVYDARQPTHKNYKVKDIDPSRLWLLEEGHCMTTQIEKICVLRKQRQSSSNLVYKSGSILSLLELVKSNKGITLLPRLATLRENLLDTNCIYPLMGTTPVRKIGVITHPNFAKKRLLKILVDEILEAVQPILSKKKKVQVINPY